MEKYKIPKELEEAVCKNEFIIFVGAGLSYNLVNIKKEALKGWSNLVRQILLHLKEEGHEVDVLIPLVDQFEPIKILDLIECKPSIPKSKISAFIKDFLDLDDENNFDLHRKLYQLSNKIITTNYDTAFEKAVPQLRKNKAYKGKNYELTTHKNANSPLLFKLHGCFEDINSMVLYPTGYQNLYQNTNKDAEHSILVLKNIILNKSILFIGAGMGDFQINNLFKEIKGLQGEYNQKHFIITKTPLDSSLHFLTPILVDDYAQIEKVIDALIEIKEACGSGDSEAVKMLKLQLEETEKKLKALEAEANPNLARLLEREALKYFSKGVEFSLEDEPEKAIEVYETALELKSDFHEALYNLGNELSKLAGLKGGTEKESLYEQAFEKYQKSIEIKPDKHQAFYNWGTSLVNLARTKGSLEGEALYAQAFKKYQKTIEIKPDSHEAFNNWGAALGNLAVMKGGVEGESLYAQAIKKYEKAIEIKPDYHKAFNNWGNALAKLAGMKGGSESESLHEQAFEKFQKAIEHGGRHYNLACLYAIRNQNEPALKHLKTSLSNKEIEPDFVLQDEDWKNYYEDPDFLALVETFKKQRPPKTPSNTSV